MVQLAARLRELLRVYGGDERAWQPRLDALDAVESRDPDRAHEIFVEAKRGLLAARHDDLLDALSRFEWLAGVPPHRSHELADREVERGIVLLERALADARAIERARSESLVLAAALSSRAAPADLASRVEYGRLQEALATTESRRRALAADVRVEERAGELARRARRLARLPLASPDVSRASVPDVSDANRLLDEFEPRLVESEAHEERYARVERSLRDAAVREFLAARRKALLARADAAIEKRDVPALDALAAEAEGLRAEGARLASARASARKRGAAGPEKERGAGDLQDYFT